MPFTSIRPTYIYGALNYNPLEEWFFERLDQVSHQSGAPCCWACTRVQSFACLSYLLACLLPCISLTQDRTIIIPGHGQHLTGLGHVQDLAVAMANVIGKDVSVSQLVNVMHDWLKA